MEGVLPHHSAIRGIPHRHSHIANWAGKSPVETTHSSLTLLCQTDSKNPPEQEKSLFMYLWALDSMSSYVCGGRGCVHVKHYSKNIIYDVAIDFDGKLLHYSLNKHQKRDSWDLCLSYFHYKKHNKGYICISTYTQEETKERMGRAEKEENSG